MAKRPDYWDAVDARDREVWGVAFAAFRDSCAHRPAAEDMWAVLRPSERRDCYDIAYAALAHAEAKSQARIEELEARLCDLLTPANSNADGLPNFLLPGPDGRRR